MPATKRSRKSSRCNLRNLVVMSLEGSHRGLDLRVTPLSEFAYGLEVDLERGTWMCDDVSGGRFGTGLGQLFNVFHGHGCRTPIPNVLGVFDKTNAEHIAGIGRILASFIRIRS